jgi:hypothetical protein
MKNATELLKAYLAEIQDPAAAAALFADDGVVELPTVNARAQGPAAIEKFLAGLLAKVPDFRFQNIRIWIQTRDQAFGEYDVEAEQRTGSQWSTIGPRRRDLDRLKRGVSRRYVAGWTGLEPAASGVTGRRYNQLNYHPKFSSRPCSDSTAPFSSRFCRSRATCRIIRRRDRV